MDSEVRIKRIVLKRMERCIVCHRQFHSDDITVISRESGMWTMLVECTDCHARNFVAAVLNDGDPEEAQLALRRLSEQAVSDIKELQAPEILTEAPTDENREPVTASDVVDMYEFLNMFDGDFKSLLKS
jgi:DNA-directed RNA polymerase subunit RPC12/RpoP